MRAGKEPASAATNAPASSMPGGFEGAPRGMQPAPACRGPLMSAPGGRASPLVCDNCYENALSRKQPPANEFVMLTSLLVQ